MKYDAVIYDIDGTLLDTIQMNMYPLLKIIEEELGEKKTFDEIKYCFSMTGKQTLEHLGIDYERVYPRWVRYVNEYEQGAEPFDGVMAMVQKVKSSGILQAVCSAKTRAQYEIDMNPELLSMMDAAVLFEDTSKHKPDLEPLEEALRRLKVSKDRALYVGDALADGKAAKACGIDFAWAKWAGIEVNDMPRPDYLLQTPDDLWQVLKDE